MINTNQLKPNKLLLIGNGLDINHKLKTSYSDFIDFYVKKSLWSCLKYKVYDDECFEIKVNFEKLNPDKLVDFPMFLELNNYKIDFKNCVQKGFHANYLNREPYYVIITKNDFIYEILRECQEENWAGIEQCIYMFLRASYSNTDRDSDKIKINRNQSTIYNGVTKNIKNLNSSIDTLKRELIGYLNTQKIKKSNIENIFKTIGILNDYSENILLLNFNYTTYLDNYIEEQTIRKSKNYKNIFSINIHGRIDSKIDDVIFGIGDEEEMFLKEIESYYSDEWLDPLKSIHYLRNNNYQSLLGFIEQGPYEIYIVGHSCSITDRTLLKMLFENDLCVKIHIMHYNGLKSYMKTAFNISRNFTSKIKLRKVLQPYDPNLTF